MKILMLVLNTFENDSRVDRAARALSEIGAEVTVFAIHREGLPTREITAHYEIIRSIQSNSRYSAPTLPPESELKKRVAVKDQQNSLPTIPSVPSSVNTATQETIATDRKHNSSADAQQRPAFGEIIGQLADDYPITYHLLSAIHSSLWLFIHTWRKLAPKLRKFTYKAARLGFRLYSKLNSSFAAGNRNDKTETEKLAAFDNRLSQLFGDNARWGLASFEIGFEKRRRKYETFAEKALEYAAIFKPTIVHAHDFNALVAAWKIKNVLGIPYVYDSHELWVERNRPNIITSAQEKLWEKEFEGKAIRGAKFSITVCDSIADHLARTYQISHPLVIRNTPERRVGLRNPEHSLRRASGFSDSAFLLVYVGKCAANRGLEDILNALPLLEANVKLVTLGAFDSKYRVLFMQHVRDLGLEERVYCHEAVPPEQINDWISDCDLSLPTMSRVCLSYVYTLPNKLFESIHAGLPILGPDSPEIIRIVTQYHCGMTYRDRDHTHLAEMVTGLLRQPELLAQFRAGSLRAADELNWDTEKVKLVNAYQETFGPVLKTPPLNVLNLLH